MLSFFVWENCKCSLLVFWRVVVQCNNKRNDNTNITSMCSELYKIEKGKKCGNNVTNVFGNLAERKYSLRTARSGIAFYTKR